MKAFAVYDLKTGVITRWGNVPDDLVQAQAQAGEGVIEGVFDPKSVLIINGRPQVRPPEPPKDPDYRERRRNAYPSIADQLDALWKGNADEMRAKIMDVKQRFPKP